MFFECAHVFAGNYGLPISLFFGGLVGSISHCAGMCAPFVLAQSADGPVLKKPFQSVLLPYHLGRMTTYVLLGAVFYQFFNLAFFLTGSRALLVAPLLLVAGILFLVSAVPSLSALFPWIVRIRLPMPRKFIGQAMKVSWGNNRIVSGYIIGVLLGFMPCGLVLAAIMAASTASSLQIAIFSMISFSIATMPILMIAGIAGQKIKAKRPEFSKIITGVSVSLSSLWLFLLAAILLFKR